jgi:hypothetical protein
MIDLEIEVLEIEIYQLNSDISNTQNEIDALEFMAERYTQWLISANLALAEKRREKRLNDLVAFCQTGRYPD